MQPWRHHIVLHGLRSLERGGREGKAGPREVPRNSVRGVLEVPRNSVRGVFSAWRRTMASTPRARSPVAKGGVTEHQWARSTAESRDGVVFEDTSTLAATKRDRELATLLAVSGSSPRRTRSRVGLVAQPGREAAGREDDGAVAPAELMARRLERGDELAVGLAQQTAGFAGRHVEVGRRRSIWLDRAVER